MSDIANVLRDIANLDDVGQRIAAIEKQAALLPDLKREYATRSKCLTDTLQKMDVVQQGNYGWENRAVHFLKALRREAIKAPNPEATS